MVHGAALCLSAACGAAVDRGRERKGPERCGRGDIEEAINIRIGCAAALIKMYVPHGGGRGKNSGDERVAKRGCWLGASTPPCCSELPVHDVGGSETASISDDSHPIDMNGAGGRAPIPPERAKHTRTRTHEVVEHSSKRREPAVLGDDASSLSCADLAFKPRGGFEVGQCVIWIAAPIQFHPAQHRLTGDRPAGAGPGLKSLQRRGPEVSMMLRAPLLHRATAAAATSTTAAGPTAALPFVFRSASSLARRPPPRPLLLPSGGGAGPLKGAYALALAVTLPSNPSPPQPNPTKPPTQRTHNSAPRARSVYSHHGRRDPRLGGGSGGGGGNRYQQQQQQQQYPPPPHKRPIPLYLKIGGAVIGTGCVVYISSYEQAPYTGRWRPMPVSRGACFFKWGWWGSCVNWENRLTRFDSHTPKIPMYTETELKLGEASNRAMLQKFQGHVLPPDHKARCAPSRVWSLRWIGSLDHTDPSEKWHAQLSTTSTTPDGAAPAEGGQEAGQGRGVRGPALGVPRHRCGGDHERCSKRELGGGGSVV